jgi:CSLREA domain-containing protein
MLHIFATFRSLISLSFRVPALFASFAFFVCLTATQSTMAQLSLTVTRSDDRNAVCISGDCSLREAINAANTVATNDTINFAQGLTTIILSSQIQIENFGALTINGLGAKVFTIDGNSRNGIIPFGNRIFYINGATVAITDVRLTGGFVAPGLGDIGGGILVNGGTLALDRVHVTGNVALIGGGIYYSGGTNHRIINSTISNNATQGRNTGSGFFLNGGTLYVANTTISDNFQCCNLVASGGGFVGSPTLRNVTVNRNSSRNFGTPIIGNPDMRNTIVLTEGGGILSPCDITAENNLIGDCDPSLLLGPLQDNGGPTPTQALLPNSQAIDAGSNAFAVDPFDNSPLLTDQRGFGRIVDGNMDGIATVDIGAFEFQGVDADGDGIADANDNCPANANPDQLDTDNDGIGNVCDDDDDNDSILDTVDNCPLLKNRTQLDFDFDGIGDACDPTPGSPPGSS